MVQPPMACEGCGRPVIYDTNRQPPRPIIFGAGRRYSPEARGTALSDVRQVLPSKRLDSPCHAGVLLKLANVPAELACDDQGGGCCVQRSRR